MQRYKDKENIREYKNILITKKNYDKLKKLGNTGDSFNFVVTKLLNRNKTLQSGDGIAAPNQIATE
jgi:predicted CopG family antitoxin